MPISIQQISYIHPDKEVLFSDLNFAISKGQKLGLVGNNGCGKSTLLQIIAGQLTPLFRRHRPTGRPLLYSPTFRAI